jgi:hypothetical protein
VRRPLSVAVAALLALLCAAPTAGDIGGCGSEPSSLDPTAFALQRKDLDCRRCQECGLDLPRCGRACDPAQPPDTSLPLSCKPLSHDGEVCIDALSSASCSKFITYVDDVAPATPSECQFCQIVPPPGSLPRFAFDAGVDASPEGGAK